VSDIQDAHGDPALEALTTLSEAATVGAGELHLLGDELSEMRQRRQRGWSWRRIMASSASANPLSAIATIVARLGRTSGTFRRAAACALREEGMRVTDIASLLGVTRQRITSLTRPRLRQSNSGAQKTPY